MLVNGLYCVYVLFVKYGLGRAIDPGWIPAISGPFGIGAMYLTAWYGNRVREMAQVTDIRVAGYLAEAATCRSASSEDNRMAAQALCTLLPNITLSSATLVTAQDRSALREILSQPKHRGWKSEPELIIAVMDALGRIADAGALPFIETLATSGRDGDVRRAAVERLPAFRQIAEEARSRETLLRPSDAPEQPLLHPAASGEADQAVLLRPAAK